MDEARRVFYLDMKEQGLAGTAWLCCLHVDLALNPTGGRCIPSRCSRKGPTPHVLVLFGFELFQGFHL